jgi:Flp pilus assembly pilin Flp
MTCLRWLAEPLQLSFPAWFLEAPLWAKCVFLAACSYLGALALIHGLQTICRALDGAIRNIARHVREARPLLRNVILSVSELNGELRGAWEDLSTRLARPSSTPQRPQ